ncbi:hypothetical protein [Vibrio coralliilyticus]|uniref:hypothetical protein n=1 Tax=Vibrio coralliilyticus TaxID=190893 RepID=UPI0017F8D084|nr:hypothetical protein [Vibrio coralliilyticus]NUW70376.1 hypothetical protein [Vibrio coralliilyticus]
MSSKFIERAWSHKCVTAEEKLVLVALAELSDRTGTIAVSVREILDMTGVSESCLKHVLQRLSYEQAIVKPRHSNSMQDGKVTCRLNIGENNTYAEVSDKVGNDKTPKLSPFQGQQAKPLQSNNVKVINIKELSVAFVADWAEMILFKRGMISQTHLWATFVEKLQTSKSSLLSLDELTARFHAHLSYEKNKNDSFSSKRKEQLSPGQELRERLQNFDINFDD